MKTATTPCPNADDHQPHPTNYVGHCGWAEKALLVADQAQCPGCGGWEIWIPKRPDLRIAADWLADCGWAGCSDECVADRHVAEADVWLPACVVHAGLEEQLPDSGAETLAWDPADPPTMLVGDEAGGVELADRWRAVDTVAPEGGVL